MKHKQITAALVMLAITSVFAQSTSQLTAQLKNVDGNVLVSTAQGAVAGVNGLAVPDKSLVTTTNNGVVDIVLPSGCTVNLKPNQRVEVDVTQTCEALLALVTTSPSALALGALGAGGLIAGLSLTSTALVVGAAAAAATVVAREFRNTSPN